MTRIAPLILLLAGTAFAADPVVKLPVKDDLPVVVLPNVLPGPTPAPTPQPVTTLTGSTLYVITSTAPVMVVASPEGLVKITAPAVPCTIVGTFSDPQANDDDGRTYAAGNVYVVRAAGVGKVELIISLDATGKHLIRRCLAVDNGQPPPAPPIPPTPPTPPTPPVDPLTAALKAAYAQDGVDVPGLIYIKAAYSGMAAAAKDRTDTNATAAAWLKSIIEGPKGLTATQLVHLRKAILVELSATLGDPTSTAPLDATKFAAELKKVSDALSGVQ